MMARVAAMCVSLAIILAPVSGCFSESEQISKVPPENLEVSPPILIGGVLQSVEFPSSSAMSVHVPYLVREGVSEFFSNGTTLVFDGASTKTIEMIAPPNIGTAYFLLGNEGSLLGPEISPIRESNQSWYDLFESEPFVKGPYSWLEHPVVRENRSGYTIEEGSMHGTGMIDGLSAFEWLEEFADPETGYNERWGPFTLYDANYMRAADYLQGYMAGMGWDAQIHRYWISDFSYAVNVCGYKTGELYPDEWLVLGAHLDVAEPGTLPGGGTRIGAHDNGAGVALVLEKI